MYELNETKTAKNSENMTTSFDEEIEIEHANGLDFGDDESPPEMEGPPESVVETVPDGQITKDQFFQSFFMGSFQMGHAFTKLQTLAIAPEDHSARAASDAIYETCSEIPALNFLIQPGNKWIERAVVVGAFALPVAVGVRTEIKARRATKVKAETVRKYEKPTEENPVQSDGNGTIQNSDGGLNAFPKDVGAAA